MTKINISEIREQLVANIYELLLSKGYKPEEGIDIEKCLHEARIPLISYLVNSYAIDPEDEWVRPFPVKYLIFDGKDYFAAYDYHPDKQKTGCILDHTFFSIESLSHLFDTLEELNNIYDTV